MRPGSGSAMTRASRPASRRRASSVWGWKPTRPSWRNSWMPNLAQALRAAGLVAAIAALLTIAVSQAGAHERKPSGPSALPAGDFGGPFVLMDHSGREVTERTYLGRLQVIYFGYTHCPDICPIDAANIAQRSEEHTSELQSLMRISYAVFCLKKKNNKQ